MGHLLYDPQTFGMPAYLAGFVLLAFVLIFLGAISSGLTRLGLSPIEALLVLGGSLLGSGINLPVGQLQSSVPLAQARLVRADGILYRIPPHAAFDHTMVLALNVGGAIIPLLICLYLTLRFPQTLPRAIAATVPVIFLVHANAQLVPGLGVAMPAYLPPIFAASSALAVAFLTGGNQRDCFVGAYFSGTMGTLIGADLLNLGRIDAMGAPVASIGGAGTFDGVFLAGILAVGLMTIPFSFAGPSRTSEPTVQP